jgi:hypothetical protein
MKLRVSVLTPIGLVLDGVIVESIRPIDAAAAGIPAAGGGGYQVECRYRSHHGRRAVVTAHHRLDVCPFGWCSPSRIFAVPGRHTNLGIVVRFDPDLCVFHLMCPDSGADVTAVLGELELLPALAGDQPTVPLPVGARIVARRYGRRALAAGEVVAANGDLTYTLRYDSDGVVEDNVLHRDVTRREMLRERRMSVSYLASSIPELAESPPPSPERAVVAPSHSAAPVLQLPHRRFGGGYHGTAAAEASKSERPGATHEAAPPAEERVTVRAMVLVALIGQHVATIIQALGGGRYRAMLLASKKVVVVSDAHVTSVRPVLHDALDADPEAVKTFITADDGLTGTIPWAAAKRALRESTQTFGLPMAESRLRSIYAELLVAGGRRQLGGHVGRALIEDSDMPLSFGDFELAFRRYRNAV